MSIKLCLHKAHKEDLEEGNYNLIFSLKSLQTNCVFRHLMEPLGKHWSGHFDCGLSIFSELTTNCCIMVHIGRFYAFGL